MFETVEVQAINTGCRQLCTAASPSHCSGSRCRYVTSTATRFDMHEWSASTLMRKSARRCWNAAVFHEHHSAALSVYSVPPASLAACIADHSPHRSGDLRFPMSASGTVL